MESGKWKVEEIERRDQVLELIREYTKRAITIPYHRELGLFSGHAGHFRYCFEGEDDLLHLIVEREDGSALEMGETGEVARFLLPDVPEAMIWMRPGEMAHHYYLGHDLLFPSNR